MWEEIGEGRKKDGVLPKVCGGNQLLRSARSRPVSQGQEGSRTKSSRETLSERKGQLRGNSTMIERKCGKVTKKDSRTGFKQGERGMELTEG